MSIRETLPELRKKQGLSARELAEKTGNGVTLSVIQNIEGGRKPDISISELILFCRALGCDVDDLVPELRAHISIPFRDVTEQAQELVDVMNATIAHLKGIR